MTVIFTSTTGLAVMLLELSRYYLRAWSKAYNGTDKRVYIFVSLEVVNNAQ